MRKLLWLTIVIAAGAYIADRVADPDLWWHIAVGRWIVANFTVPHVDYWNMFSGGRSWIAYSWSFEAIVSLIEADFGVHGLYLAQLLLAITLCAALSAIFSKLAGDWFFGTLCGVYATFSFHSHYTLRPQCVVWLLFAFTLLQLENISNEGLQRRYAIRLIITFAIWANLHISTGLGLFVIPFWLHGSAPRRTIFASLALAFGGTLITPYLGAEWLTFFSKSGHPFQYSAIAEFKPATVLLFSTAFLILALCLSAAFFHFKPRAVEPGKLILLFIFTMLGLGVIKFLPLSVILCCAVLSLYWGRGARDPESFNKLGEGIRRFKQLFLSIPREGLAFIFICWAIVSIINDWKRPLDPVVPAAAFDFYESNSLPLPLLSTFGNGGYAIYRFTDSTGKIYSAEHRASIDGRTNVVPHEIWEKFIAALEGKENWREYFEAVNPSSVLWRKESPLNAILLLSTEWCRVYRDQQGYSIYLRADLTPRFPNLEYENCSPSIEEDL